MSVLTNGADEATGLGVEVFVQGMGWLPLMEWSLQELEVAKRSIYFLQTKQQYIYPRGRLLNYETDEVLEEYGNRN